MVFQNSTQIRHWLLWKSSLVFVAKQIRLQYRTYLGVDNTTKYIQYRINLPEKIIRKIGWEKEDHITVSVESRNGKKTISLKIKD